MAKETKPSIGLLIALMPSIAADFGNGHQFTKDLKSLIYRWGGESGARFIRESDVANRSLSGSPNPRTNVRRIDTIGSGRAAFTSPQERGKSGLNRRVHPSAKQHIPAAQTQSSKAGEQEQEISAEDLAAEILTMVQEGMNGEQIFQELQTYLTAEQLENRMLEIVAAIEAAAKQSGNVAAGETATNDEIQGEGETAENQSAETENQTPVEPLTSAELDTLNHKSPDFIVNEFGRDRIDATLTAPNPNWNDKQAASALKKQAKKA